jgi:hypothetical protein
MRGKKAFELSATFMVILILTIVIFTGSIYFTKNFFASAQEMKGSLDADTQAEIESLLYRQNALVGLPLNRKSVPVGQSTTFGVGVRNTYEDTKEFYMTIAFSKAYDINEEVLSEPDAIKITDEWLLYNEGPHVIQPNDFVSIPVLVNVNTQMAEGVPTRRDSLYTFNVCVFDDRARKQDCESSRSILTSVYGNKVLKININT